MALVAKQTRRLLDPLMVRSTLPRLKVFWSSERAGVEDLRRNKTAPDVEGGDHAN